ncbi:hypothetical protein GCM10025789_07770 [Tessaracoccus lubricantis]|uniref:Uncharacterized protein n=1 Tax=Tessaracoccus lubricantis TaxID=545543 RepID=A0ABP9F341_9ACTN
MNDDFHDLFKQSVPQAPSPNGWATAARRKRRSRQMVAGSLSAGVVLALGVPLALNLSLSGAENLVASPEPTVSSAAPTTSPEETPQPAPSVTAPSPEVSLSTRRDGQPGAEVCYNEVDEPVGSWINIGTIDTGAARAWLCTSDYGTVGPLEPLVVDVDGLVEALYAQPPLTEADAPETAQSYTVIFEYDDGRKAAFTGDIQDSTELTDGDTSLQGSEAFFRDEIEARWLAQRQQLGRPVGEYAPVQACPVTFNQALFPVELDEVVGGYACALEAGEPTKNVELRESVAAQIGAEALANSVPTEAADSDDAGQRTLVLRNVWGDELRLEQRGDGYEFRGETSLMRWTPAPEFAAELDALFAG